MDWTDTGWSDIEVELYCFLHFLAPSDGALGRYRHFKNAAKLMWPGLIWHDWSVEMIRGLCENKTSAWTGAAACGKTFSAGVFAMLWWLCEPKTSTVILTSTTGKMVRKRIWPVIQELYHSCATLKDSPLLCEGFPGNLVDSKTTLQAEKGDDKHGLFALAVREGSTSKAVADIQGLHSDRMLLIIDEATDTPEAIFEAITNLRKGCREFILLVIGNPSSHMDPHGMICEPEKGWGRITIDDDDWKTAGVSKWEIDPGLCLHFDGEKSPNITCGENKFPFLISAEDVTRAAKKDNGQQSPSYWKFTRGFWAPEGICNTIFSEAMVERLNGKGTFTFHSSRIELASLDPAFGGDRCKLKFGSMGDIDSAGKLGLTITDSFDVVPKARSKKELDFQIAHQVMDECRKRGVQPKNFIMDATGIGRGVAAIMAEEWSMEINRVEFGDKASDKQASVDDPRPSHEVYDRRVTELWFSVRELLQAGQLNGLTQDDIVEFCNREYSHEKRKIKLQTKDECKKTIGKSPDNADAVALLVELARRLGVTPNTGRMQDDALSFLRVAQKYHAVYDDPRDDAPELDDRRMAVSITDFGWD